MGAMQHADPASPAPAARQAPSAATTWPGPDPRNAPVTVRSLQRAMREDIVAMHAKLATGVADLDAVEHRHAPALQCRCAGHRFSNGVN